MKKYISGVLTGIIITLSLTGFAATVKIKSAKYTATKVSVDGELINTQVVNVIDEGKKYGKNYTSVRDVAEALGADVNMVGDTIEITRPKELTTEQVAKDNLDNCVLIRCYTDGKLTGTGSGVLIDGNRILTNKHVLDMGKEYGITYQWAPESSEYKTNKRIDVDTDLDIALLESPIEADNHVTFGDSDNVEIGNDIVLISSPKAMRNTVSIGIVSSIVVDFGMNHFQITAKATSGSSGGGLFNMNGELIGLMQKGADGEDHFAIMINEIKEVLSTN